MDFGSISNIEIVAAIILASYLCLEKKYNIKVLLSIFAAFLIINYFACSYLIRLDKENRFSTMFTFFFLFPVLFLYKDSILKKLMLLLTVWIHVFAIENITGGLSNFLITDMQVKGLAHIIMQTVLLAATFPLVVRFIKIESLFLINNVSKKYFRFFVLSTVFWFAIIFFARYVLLNNHYDIFEFLLFAMLTLAIWAVYPLVVYLAKDTMLFAHMEQLVQTDALTKAYSRNKLYIDGEELIKQNMPFAIIYLDLDFFKSVNDTYGHYMGDRYLKAFAQAVNKMIQPLGKLYRIAGDEFAIICASDQANTLVSRIHNHEWREFSDSVPFRGVSIGYCENIMDGSSMDKLIYQADKRMYDSKKAIHCETRHKLTTLTVS